MSVLSNTETRTNLIGVLSLAAVLSASAACLGSFDRAESARVASTSTVAAKRAAVVSRSGPSVTANQQIEALRKLYQQQQNVAAISNMMRMQHMTNMSIINNIGSSNTRYEYRYVRRP
jgi:phage gp37-like protein